MKNEIMPYLDILKDIRTCKICMRIAEKAKDPELWNYWWCYYSQSIIRAEQWLANAKKNGVYLSPALLCINIYKLGEIEKI
jgi:hypothetical protein